MELEAVRYDFEGVTLTGYLADGAAGRPAPGILVAHEGPGVGPHEKERASRLAELGYVALALDLYGEAEPPLERARELVQTLRADVRLLRGRTAAALRVLEAHPKVDSARIAAIGFCFGGTAVIELARSGAALACVVGFHAGLTSAPEPENRAIACPLLLCLGAEDPIVMAAQRDSFVAEMSAAGVDWQLHLYGGVGHSFTNRHIDAHGFPGFAYHEAADARSWRAMLNLFEEVLEPS